MSAYLRISKGASFGYRLLAVILLAALAFLCLFLPLEILKVANGTDPTHWALIYMFGALDVVGYLCLIYVCRRIYWVSRLDQARAFALRAHGWNLAFLGGTIALLYFVFIVWRGIYSLETFTWLTYLLLGVGAFVHILIVSLCLITTKKRRKAER